MCLFLCCRCHQCASVCAVCHHVVKGLFVWCQGCSHGGHLEHVMEWLKSSIHCPAGCGHLCEYAWHTHTRVRNSTFIECQCVLEWKCCYRQWIHLHPDLTPAKKYISSSNALWFYFTMLYCQTHICEKEVVNIFTSVQFAAIKCVPSLFVMNIDLNSKSLFISYFITHH